MLLQDKTLAFLGAGHMASALIKGLFDARAVTADALRVADPDDDARRALTEAFGLRCFASNAEASAGADIVVLAVKPQVVPRVAAELRATLTPRPLVLSVAAGVTTQRLEALLAHGTRVVRSMPNAAATVGHSATALCLGAHASADDLRVARAIFETVGRVVALDEAHLDAVTGLSGSGPAYAFVILDALADAGVKVGLPRATARMLATQTLLGAAHMALASNEHPSVLKDRVTSPGGTTIHGLHALEAGGLRAALINAVEAATERARALGAAADAAAATAGPER